MSSPPQVRRQDKVMPDEEARTLLAGAYCGRLATVGPDGWPYVIPLLYVWVDGEIWTHNTRVVGHLRTNVNHESRVCFEVDEPGEIFPYGRFDCDTTIAYRSVVVFGTIRVVEDPAQKARFCDALMAKYGDPGWGRTESFYPRLDQITVYAVKPDLITGKQTPLPEAGQQWPAVVYTKTPNAKH
jgi:nitroimidazol reductase NimA-like FMN-containing flavoprotein (pyridoxamine 5'-phosphate oxidase superfamily)